MNKQNGKIRVDDTYIIIDPKQLDPAHPIEGAILDAAASIARHKVIIRRYPKYAASSQEYIEYWQEQIRDLALAILPSDETKRNDWQNIISRFWQYVDKSGECWLWTGAVEHSGYGIFTYPDSETGRTITQKAHRMMWLIQNGAALPTSLVIRHTCDCRTCVNPDHLIPGTNMDNSLDMVRRGRSAYGTPQKLTFEIVQRIRKRYAAGGITQKELADKHGISLRHMQNILEGKVWVRANTDITTSNRGPWGHNNEAQNG